MAAGSYRVVAGDTLYAIAFRHGLDFRDIAAWNHIAPPYRIYAGQELRLQGPASATAATKAQSASASTPAPTAAKAGASTKPAQTPQPGNAGAGMFEDVPAETASAAGTPSTQESAAAGTGSNTPVEKAAERPKATAESTARPAAAETAPAPPAARVSPSAASNDSVATGPAGIAWRWPGRGSLIGTYVAGDQTRQGIDIAGNAGDPVVAAADGEVVYSGNGLLGYGELIIVKHNASFLSAYGHNRKRLVQEGEKIKGGQQIAEMGSSASARDELHFEIRKNGKPVNPLDYLPAR